MTGCECEQPGFCVRHGVHKSQHWHHLCQTRENYFDAWERGRGPGQGLPARQEEIPSPVELASAEQIACRRAACGGCDQYMGEERCKRLELGCGRMYRARLTKQDGKCPMGRWSE